MFERTGYLEMLPSLRFGWNGRLKSVTTGTHEKKDAEAVGGWEGFQHVSEEERNILENKLSLPNQLFRAKVPAAGMRDPDCSSEWRRVSMCI